MLEFNLKKTYQEKLPLFEYTDAFLFKIFMIALCGRISELLKNLQRKKYYEPNYQKRAATAHANTKGSGELSLEPMMLPHISSKPRGNLSHKT